MKKAILLLALVLVLASCQQVQEFNDTEIPEDPVEEVEDSKSPEMHDSPEEQMDTPRENLQAYLDMRPSFKATYEVVSQVEGETKRGEETVVIKGDNSKRSYSGESFYVLDNKVYLCQDGECWDIPQEEPPTEIDTSIPEGVTVTEAPGRTVAGVSAECFTLTGNNESVIDCRSEQGVLVYFSRNAQGYSIEMTAQSIDNSVSNSEFELPSEPREFNPEEFQNTQVSN